MYRTLSMVEKYRGGVLTNGDASGDQAVADASADIEEKAKQTLEDSAAE